MKNITCLILCAALLAIAVCAIPAGAVVLQVTVKGTVSDISSETNTLTLSAPLQYGCDYGSGTSAPVCSWTPLNSTTLTGTVPDQATFSVIAKGDQAVAVSLGGTGGTWISLAKLYGSGTSADDATDEIGDIGSLPVALIGDYAVSAGTVPDCSACTGTTCTATSSNVTVTSGKMTVAEKTLLPGQSLFFNGRNDASSVNVTFVKGEALSGTCPGKAGLVGGVQPVSDYIVHIVPPLAVTVTTHGTDALVTGESTAAASPAVSSVPAAAATTTPTSALPFAGLSILGLGIAALALAGLHRRN
ncbi:MAG: hypothetical protein WC362_01020 [Methanoregula sp.]|jgi:hypothetical protein